MVTFHKLGEGQARVTVQIDAEPDGPIESAGEALGLLERRVKGDLERFKQFIESRGDETGAWRARSSRTRPPEVARQSARRSSKKNEIESVRNAPQVPL